MVPTPTNSHRQSSRSTTQSTMTIPTTTSTSKAWFHTLFLVVFIATSNYASLYLGMRLSSDCHPNSFTALSSMDIYNNDNNLNTNNLLRRSQREFNLQTSSTSMLSHHKSNTPILVADDNTDIISKVVLVTGGAGFIGSHVAVALLQRGDIVIILDNMNDYYNVSIKESNLEWVREVAAQKKNIEQGVRVEKGGDSTKLLIYYGDINNSTLLHDIFEHQYQRNQPITHICHLAARAGVRPSIQNPHMYIETNILGTVNLLEHAREHNIQNIVMASSSSVYGEVVVDAVSKDNPNDEYAVVQSSFSEEIHVANTPLSPYAHTKRSVELLSYTYHTLYHLNITNLRFFTVYGPRGRPDMAPHIFISNIFQGKPIEQFGDGNSSRDYTYIDDVVNGVLRSLDRSYPYQIINIGAGSTGITLSNFISLIEKHVGKHANIVKLPTQMGDVSHTRANITKAKELLGYIPKISMDEGVRKTVEWYKETNI